MKTNMGLRPKLAVLSVAAVLTQMPAFAEDAAGAEAAAPARVYGIGPYVSVGVGGNRANDQTFDFRGTHTLVTQPTVPVELPALPNTGIASVNSYKDAVWYNATVGYEFESGLRPEFEIAYRSNKIDSIAYPDAGPGPQSEGDNVKQTASSGMFNLWYDLFANSSRIQPYFGAGLGFIRFKLNKQPTNQLSHSVYIVNLPAGPLVCPTQDCSGPRKSDDATYAYQAGAGVRWDFTDDVTVSLDYRYLKSGKAKFYGFKDQQETHLDGDYDAHSVMVSAAYYFARPAPPLPPAPAPVEVVKPVTPPPACSDGLDNDNDGLVDFPNDKGCTGPEDLDEADPCKPPAAGERIDLRGCATGDKIVLRGVNFDFNKATLTVNARTILDGVSEALLAAPEITVEIGGHTDSLGSDSYNQRLSERRAASVVEYLGGKGVPAERMTPAGYGESEPIDTNETEEGREINRRVELKVLTGVARVESAAPVDAVAPAADAAAVDAAAPVAEPVAESAAPTADAGISTP